LIRIAIMIVVGSGSIFALKKLGYLNLAPIFDAFRRNGAWIGLALLSLAGLLGASAVRFFILIRSLGLPTAFRNVLAANLIGQAIGQWLPGSLAVTEVLRFGVMAGMTPRDDAGRIAPNSGLKGRLGLAIAVDRLLGLGAMFTVGGLAGFFLIARRSIGRGFLAAVIPLSAAMLVLGLLGLAAPFRPYPRLQRLAGRAAGTIPGATSQNESAAPPRGLFRRAAWNLFRLFETLKEFRSGDPRSPSLFILSFASALLNPLILYGAARAAGVSLSFPVILAAVPLTVAAILLPTGIAGYGGPQLLSAGVFPLFGAGPEMVVTACLLQNTIILAGQTLGGAMGLALLAGRTAGSQRKRG
jgi:uncharacterized membrane protein YbhN (UPF0104 family)